LESSWKWNAWVTSGSIWRYNMAAHLLDPVGAFDWLCRVDFFGAPRLQLVFLDAENLPWGWQDVVPFPAGNFPYGYEVDQTRLALT